MATSTQNLYRVLGTEAGASGAESRRRRTIFSHAHYARPLYKHLWTGPAGAPPSDSRSPDPFVIIECPPIRWQRGAGP